MDKFTAIRVFVNVVETGAFVRAAESVGLSRPMVSKYVGWLEQDLGIKLLNRTTRTLSPTEAGRGFYIRAKDILSRLDEAEQEASSQRIEPKGEVRITAPHAFGRQHLARALASFQLKYPDITVDLVLSDRLVDLVDEGFDLAVRIGRLVDSSLIARKLSLCALQLCAAPAYLEQYGCPTHPSDLIKHNCLHYSYFSEGARWTFHQDGQVMKIPVTGSFRANSGDAIVEMAVSGVGIAMEPYFLMESYLEAGVLVPLLKDFEVDPRGVYAVYPENRLLPQKVRVLIDHLVHAFAKVRL